MLRFVCATDTRYCRDRGTGQRVPYVGVRSQSITAFVRSCNVGWPRGYFLAQPWCVPALHPGLVEGDRFFRSRAPATQARPRFPAGLRYLNRCRRSAVSGPQHHPPRARKFEAQFLGRRGACQ